MMFNCNVLGDGKIIHLCHPETCVYRDAKDSRRRMIRFFSTIVFGRRVRRPQLKEWTAVRKLG